jgi:hypothetical protein
MVNIHNCGFQQIKKSVMIYNHSSQIFEKKQQKIAQ